MLVGVNLPNYSSLGNTDSMIAIAEAAEALGYASLWTNDHVLLPTSRPEPFGNVPESLTTLSCSPPDRLLASRYPPPIRPPASRATPTQSSTNYRATAKLVSIASSSNLCPATWTTFCV